MNDSADACPQLQQELILLVTGDAPRSRRARQNLARALEQLDLGDIATREVDLVADPAQTLAYGIFATPALLRPGPNGQADVLYGDLSEREMLERFLAQQ
ncbi:circadian clock KaiB family protein [Thiohalocapsa halophila]